MPKVKVVSHKEFKVEIEKLGSKIMEGIEVDSTLEAIVLSVKAFCPVITGALRDSVRSRKINQWASMIVAGGAGYINPMTGREVDYAIYVHEGTSRMPANPFIRRAIEREKLTVGKRILTESLERI